MPWSYCFVKCCDLGKRGSGASGLAAIEHELSMSVFWVAYLHSRPAVLSRQFGWCRVHGGRLNEREQACAGRTRTCVVSQFFLGLAGNAS